MPYSSLVSPTTQKIVKMRFLHLALLFFDFEETYWQQQSLYQKRLRDKRIPRCALKFFNHSPWFYMYNCGNDQALVNMTGLDHFGFSKMLKVFKPYWDAYVMDRSGNIKGRKKIRSRVGRPRHLCALGGLGLVLTWYKTKGARSRNLAMQFGLTSTPMSTWHWFGLCCLRAALVNHPKAKICAPTVEEVEIYKAAISALYPSLLHVWGAVDGLKLRVSVSQNWREQITFYNGRQHNHFVNNIFLFAPDGPVRD